jgi:5-methylcytosine-specific restriction endonuclease McrA
LRTEFSAKTKAAAALRAAGHCEQCTRKLITGDYHYDHEIPDALGGSNDLSNCRVLCRSCHMEKTSSEDVPRIAKAKRNYRKARGIKKPSKFAGSRDSKWKKKLNGEVVLRNILKAG